MWHPHHHSSLPVMSYQEKFQILNFHFSTQQNGRDHKHLYHFFGDCLDFHFNHPIGCYLLQEQEGKEKLSLHPSHFWIWFWRLWPRWIFKGFFVVQFYTKSWSYNNWINLVKKVQFPHCAKKLNFAQKINYILFGHMVKLRKKGKKQKREFCRSV